MRYLQFSKYACNTHARAYIYTYMCRFPLCILSQEVVGSFNSMQTQMYAVYYTPGCYRLIVCSIVAAAACSPHLFVVYMSWFVMYIISVCIGMLFFFKLLIRVSHIAVTIYSSITLIFSSASTRHQTDDPSMITRPVWKYDLCMTDVTCCRLF